MPTFNQAAFLNQAINSVVNQSFKNWELIVIDNNSTDFTSKILSTFKDSRIKKVKIQNNGVISKSRNLGIKKSSGNWIAFLDSDDIWFENKLEYMTDCIIKNPNFEVFCNDEMSVNFTNGDSKRLEYGPYKKNFYDHLLLYGNCVSTSATIVNREFLTKTNLEFSEDISIRTAEDYDLWLKLALNGARFYFADKVLGEYRIHSNNNSSSIDIHYNSVRKVVFSHINRLKLNPRKNKKYLRKAETRLLLSFAKALYVNRCFLRMIYTITKSFYNSPQNFFGLIFRKFFRLKLIKI
jgi:glycosyltransferase involved in cell wall biosynthesis